MSNDLIENEIILDSEELFKIKLLEKVGSEWLMLKSQYQMCCIDFIMVNKQNLKSIHLEHKRRSGSKCNFN